MDEYDYVKKSSLKFKGEKKKKRKRSNKSSSEDSKVSQANSSDHKEVAEDLEAHGGWWKASVYEHIRDDVALEFIPGCYAKAISNGSIILGDPHPPGEGPDEEEIFTAISASTNQVALKSGFGRYLGVDTQKRLMGLSEAIGEKETFLPVFEDGRLALCAYNDCFLSPEEIDSEPRRIVARATQVGSYEIVTIRINNDPSTFAGNSKSQDGLSDEAGALYEAELNYLKTFKKEREDPLDIDKKQLKKARVEGQLYETLLDKRVKQKSDKYCK